MSGRPGEEASPGLPEGGFDGIVDLYGGQSLAFAMNVLGNREDAEDVVQESFVQVFRNLGAYDPGRSFKTWLFTIVYRRCLDMMKKEAVPSGVRESPVRASPILESRARREYPVRTPERPFPQGTYGARALGQRGLFRRGDRWGPGCLR